MRRVIGILTGLGDGAPAQRLAGDRAHILGMAIPAALADVDVASDLLLGCVVDRPAFHPFELTKIGTHHAGHPIGGGLRLEHGEDALGEGRKRDKAETCNQRDCS